MTDGIGQQFMKQTEYPFLEASHQRMALPQPPLELGPDPDQPLIDLAAPGDLAAYPLDLQQAIAQRKTTRRYAEQPLSLDELSFLLWCTQGVKEIIDSYATLRTVPSAGARHAFETYVLVNRVEGLPPGLFRFLAIEHKLAQLPSGASLAEALTRACWDQTQVRHSAVTFIWSAVAYRMTWRYGERGYRYLLLDAGHVCQNLYLAAEAISAGACAIAAFNDEALNELLGLDGKEQFVVYLASVGKKP
jgi:SagB-type dehydrogenase family enzyme